MTEGDPSVSVVIPMYNASATIGDQLESLASLDPAPDEVVVVDNASTDDSRAVAEAYAGRFDRLTVLECRRRGANAARNAGVAACTGTHVAFLDADDRVEPGWYERVVDALPWDAMAGGLRDADVDAGRWRPRGEARLSIYAHPFLPDVCTASAGVRIGVWREIDGFDESYSQGGDDTEFFWRVMLAGYEVAEIPDAVVQYRSRSGLRAIWRQRFHHGRAEARLYREFAPLGWRGSFRLGELRGFASSSAFLLLRRITLRDWFERLAAASGAVYGATVDGADPSA